MYCSKESRNILIFGSYIFITQDTSCFRFIALTKACIKIKELFSDFYYKLGKERKDPLFIEGNTFTSIGRTLPCGPHH